MRNTFLQLLFLKVWETFLFRQSKKVSSILWPVWVFFAFLMKRRSNRCCLSEENLVIYTVKLRNSGHLRVLKNLTVIRRCPLLGGSLTKIVTFGTKHFVRYSSHVRYFGCPLLGGFTVCRYLVGCAKVKIYFEN